MSHVSFRRILTHDQLRQIVPADRVFALDPTAINFAKTFAQCEAVDADASVEPGVVYDVVRSTGHRAFTRHPLPDDKIKAKVIGHQIAMR